MHPEHHLLHFAPSVLTPTRWRWVKTVGRRLRRKSGLPPHPSGLPPPCYLHTGWPSAHTRVPAELGLEVATGAGWRSTKGGLAHGRMWNALVSPLSEKQNAAYFLRWASQRLGLQGCERRRLPMLASIGLVSHARPLKGSADLLRSDTCWHARSEIADEVM